MHSNVVYISKKKTDGIMIKDHKHIIYIFSSTVEPKSPYILSRDLLSI